MSSDEFVEMTGFDAALRVASKAYKRVGPATCAVVEQTEGRAILQIRNAWEFPAWQIGIYLGGFEAFDKKGHGALPAAFTVRPRSGAELDVTVGGASVSAAGLAALALRSR